MEKDLIEEFGGQPTESFGPDSNRAEPPGTVT
jgi:hypothetical protein